MVRRLDHDRVDLGDDDGDLVPVVTHELCEELALRRDDDPVAPDSTEKI